MKASSSCLLLYLLHFSSLWLKRAYIALHAWKQAIHSDPFNSTANWVGPNVCDYNGVFCAEALDDPKQTVVAGIDLNHFDIAGFLPVELGLLTDISLFHINSNRFCGIIPKSFSKLTILHELDVSTTDLSVHSQRLLYHCLHLSSLTLGSSTASVVVVANNKLTGCIPSSIGNMVNTLNEIIFSNNNLSGCLPFEIGKLGNLTVLDVSSNAFSGPGELHIFI
ncbi:hypothetical protein GH714_005559 [Hevea brasiliensis]|uniref:Cell wall hydroxyproline-rich glycoprotein n=1 Tax=Hevea brasiliensis TaxID=3981 RepID=A0A6A6M9H7_HEVBR|nr:hypothetical protein GH714_005559 [Hevea brasiliensis]